MKSTLGAPAVGALVIILVLDAIVAASPWAPPETPPHVQIEDTSYWMKSGQENLRRVLTMQNNVKRARNVIIFIGDGMGPSTVTSGRIFKGQRKGKSGEEYKLFFEQFPSTGFSKTYNVDKQVPDSAGTATAIFSGVKAQYRMLGLNHGAKYNVCDKKVNEESYLTTIASWAQESGMDTGFVTTTRVTHATPGALYAHTNNRDWECDSQIPSRYRDVCIKDIARQLVEDAPGNKFKVIMGGGAGAMGMRLKSAPFDSDGCHRQDGRQLDRTWLEANPKAKIVTTTQELLSVNVTATDKLMGIFADSHLPYAAVKNDSVPTLANMTVQAIKMLRKNRNGFFLLVEGGKIDLAHHQNYAQLALHEVMELDDAVTAAAHSVDIDETLIIVTADHSHAFTMNGYPKRGNNILGLTTANENPQTFETLSYANGPGYYYHRINETFVNQTWRNLEEDETKKTNPYYRHFAARYLKDETHGGEDVGVYAIGPYSHLFRSTFEQNYIAHVVAYAACFKDWPSHCDQSYVRYYYDTKKYGTSSASALVPTFLILALVISHIMKYI
ncbi:alkaline phosphatase 4-like [Copidosoma floridanum]|uniref:alkaline phosphatase 4-like n=1 Tax=Copidosoma floridanum TaxID=29053 RepID=UPI0006C94629|nr:alkaline phosphatase 4-like [Copidosoma floridanum]